MIFWFSSKHLAEKKKTTKKVAKKATKKPAKTAKKGPEKTVRTKLVVIIFNNLLKYIMYPLNNRTKYLDHTIDQCGPIILSIARKNLEGYFSDTDFKMSKGFRLTLFLQGLCLGIIFLITQFLLMFLLYFINLQLVQILIMLLSMYYLAILMSCLSRTYLLWNESNN